MGTLVNKHKLSDHLKQEQAQNVWLSITSTIQADWVLSDVSHESADSSDEETVLQMENTLTVQPEDRVARSQLSTKINV